MPSLSSSTPLVSIVMTAYNVAHYIGEALDSVRAQTYRHYEIIVIDDESSDTTAQVAQQKGDVRYSYQQRTGVGIARNRGVELARGELLAFLDADDLWAPEKLAQQVELYKSLPSIPQPTLIYAHVRQFYSPEIDASELAHIRLPDAPQPAHLPSALLLSPADLQAIGPYQSILGDSIDWYLRALEAGAQVHVLPDTLLFRRIHKTNMSRTQAEDKQQYVRSLKASLDRRRQRAAASDATDGVAK